MKKRTKYFLLLSTLFTMSRSLLVEAAVPGTTLRQKVDQTCGACHTQAHLRPPGNYSLNSGAEAHTPGVFANGTDPTTMVNSDPLLSLLIQKPMEGSVTPHGGIKISSTTETMVALIDWVNRGAPSAEMDRGALGQSIYSDQNAADHAALAYKNPGGANHVIVYVRRKFRSGSFRSLVNSGTNGNIFLQRFNNPNTPVGGEVNLTNLPASDDVQSPSASLDATKIVFSRKETGQPWQIWEVNSDGSGGLRQITNGTGDKIQPFYLPYLPDGTATRAGEGGIGYLSNEAGFLDEYETGLSYSLFVCDLNGGNKRQIDFNPSNDIHPWLHSSGMLVFTRWEHNEHQGHNFMSLFALTAADYQTAGAGLFGAFGEHRTTSGNSYHEASEILGATYGQTDPDLFNPTYGNMIVRRSMRDSDGGSIGGPFIPRLQQDSNGGFINENTIAVGDMVESGNADDDIDITNISSITYRHPRSLLGGRYVVSVATLTAPPVLQLNTFNGTTSYVLVYSSWSAFTFDISGANVMQNLTPLVAANDDNVDEVIPLVVKPQPPRIAKPVDLTKTTGIFTSGNVTDRNPNDGQPNTLSVSNLSMIRFIRSLQLSQGRVDTGRRNDDGIATQLVGEVPISSDGSFAAEVPANVPLQFQLIDKSGRVVVNHKPWIHVVPGATERCVGCHARHDKLAVTQSLVARQTASVKVDTTKVTQFNFHQDIQPLFNAKCVSCHDSALVSGGAGRTRALSLSGRDTPSRTTESFEMLVGGDYVVTQHSNSSPLMWWLTETQLDVSTSTAYPSPAATVPHRQMLTAVELAKIAKWIDTGINFRVIENDQVGQSLQTLDVTVFRNTILPLLQTQCMSCHVAGGSGEFAMNLDGDPMNAESAAELEEEQLKQLTRRINFMIPEASLLLRKPLPTAISGLTHVGGVLWTKESPNYLTLYNWIVNSNPALALAPPPTDLINVNVYPSPFRDTATFVYGLTGVAATKVELKIYSRSGKLIRELSGSTTPGATVGWNKIIWDGEDKNGKTIGNDVYFYTVQAEFGDGTIKKFRGKCVKVN